MNQEGHVDAPSVGQLLQSWRSDASAERGPGGVVRLPRLRVPMLLTIKEVSGWLNIKPSTLYLWAAQGKIPCLKIHGVLRFERENIAAWLRSFGDRAPKSTPKWSDALLTDVDALIAAAKRDTYTLRHGETISPSPTGKENENGAR